MGLTEDEFFKEPPYKFLVRQLSYYRSNDRAWEKVRMLMSTVYNATPGRKRSVNPKKLIPLSIDRKFRTAIRDEELIKRCLEAWQPIKAEA